MKETINWHDMIFYTGVVCVIVITIFFTIRQAKSDGFLDGVFTGIVVLPLAALFMFGVVVFITSVMTPIAWAVLLIVISILSIVSYIGTKL